MTLLLKGSDANSGIYSLNAADSHHEREKDVISPTDTMRHGENLGEALAKKITAADVAALWGKMFTSITNSRIYATTQSRRLSI